jgi:hypothetical protein
MVFARKEGMNEALVAQRKTRRPQEPMPERACGSKSRRTHQNGALAQLGERVLCKDEVRGPNPLSSTKDIVG